MKHLFGLVAVVCMTASCNKEEVLPKTYDSGTYINFGTPFLTVSSVSRASSARLLTDFPESARFGVFGYCLAYTPGTGTSNRVIDYQSGSALWELKSSRCPADVLYNVPVTYTRGVCSYEYVGGGPRNGIRMPIRKVTTMLMTICIRFLLIILMVTRGIRLNRQTPVLPVLLS